MYQPMLGRIREGMDVCDRAQGKIGTVGKIYRPAGVTAQPGHGQPVGGTEPYLKIDTGFLGLGKDLFVPASHVLDVTQDCVRLDVEKDSIDLMGWDQKPSFIQE